MFSRELHINKRDILVGRILAGLCVVSFALQPFLLRAEDVATTTIATDTALSKTTLENSVNTNEIDTGTSTPLGDVTISLENEAVVTNEATTTAETGDNTVAGETAVIETGNAYAGANVLNVVNTNIINSYGLMYLLNTFFGVNGNIDLRDFQNASSTPNGCGEGCSATLTSAQETVSASSTASVSNSVVVRAQTGENSAEGDGTIETGDAYASANVINVANTNIVDSNYLLFTFNNFGGWNGDLVLPTADFFTNFFFGGKGSTLAFTTISVENSADVENTISTEANTGENESEGGNIETGQAVSDTNIFNQINTNLIGGTTLRILIRVHGNWLGNIFNAPEGVYWQQAGDGVEVFNLPEENQGNKSPFSAFSDLSLTAVNNASITNDVSVVALTGENRVEGEGNIETGNAYASANIVNVANTNVIGQNWILAILNIFGDWNGSLSFGQPDLWVGTTVDIPEIGFFSPNDEAIFHYTIMNRGDAPASNVRLQNRFNKRPFFAFAEGYNYYDEKSQTTGWDIGTIPPGGVVELTYSAKANKDLPFQDVHVLSTASVSSYETDADTKDNADTLELVASDYVPGDVAGPRLSFTEDPDITVTKTDDVFGLVAGTTTAQYKIVIENNGGPAYHSVLVDTLKDEEGNILNEQSWDLDEIRPGERIEVTYTSVFKGNTPAGTYTNFAQIHSIGRHPSLNPLYGMIFDSNIASASVIFATRDEVPFVAETGGNEEEATSTLSVISSTGRAIDPIPTINQKDTEIISLETPLSVPLSPLLSKVLAFKDSIRQDNSQTASALYAFNMPQEARDLFLLVLALLFSSVLSNYLVSRTRLRNAFTSF